MLSDEKILKLWFSSKGDPSSVESLIIAFARDLEAELSSRVRPPNQRHRRKGEMVSREDFELLREWIQAEIDVQIAGSEVGADGYYSSPVNEKREANRLFNSVVDRFCIQPKPTTEE